MGSFPPSFGNLYILVAMDYVCKWVKAAALPTNNDKAVVKFLQNNIFSRFGTSRAIVSDKGTHLWNKIFVVALAKYKIKQKVVTTYSRQISG